MSVSARLRRVWWTLHRWVGIGLLALLVPISVSGALLVWHDHLDAVVNPSRYAISGTQLLDPSAYLASAATAVEGRAQPMVVRYPEHEGWPVIVSARGTASEGGPPRFLNVYLDPPTARSLAVVDFRSSLIGFLHRFHENLTIPEYSGRAIVGWAGVGMLILSLTGIWLWWPRSGAFVHGLRWRRAAHTSSNLHHLFGFWISIPLAAVSFTGIYLGFPQTAREVMSSIAPMTPQGPRLFGAPLVRDARLTPERALDAALAAQPGARAAAIFLPIAIGNSGERARAAEQQGRSAEQGRGPEQQGRGDGVRSATWRVQVRDVASDAVVTMTIDDRTGAVTQLRPLTGDRAAQWIRWIHEGSHSGPVWQFVVFLTGVLPLVFAVTGLIMWWRGRRRRAHLAATLATSRNELQAAE